RVRQVSASIAGEWQAVQIIRADGRRVADVRPLVRLNVSVVVGEGDRMEAGSNGAGGRVTYERYMQPETWRGQVDEALRQALVNLGSVPAPAGEMPVVLGPGWCGVLLHEAIGHGLEGDFNRKQTSAFSSLIGQRVAAPGVTVVDDGSIEDRRGSLSVDDEGTPTQCTTLIEDGILVGYMQDRLNARLMGVKPTGNGRRQSFAHVPMPRMTNTIMRSGTQTKEEILASVKRGIYAVNFGGGQVDIVSGKFVFSASEAYLIEDGKVGPAVKGATLIGNGPDALTKVTMIGDDSELDPGIGVCGKQGQGVPVGVGQPTMRIDGLTVGGTAAKAA
ncbi:MAG TPA: metallopeptidase TldD-related protein, partial [Alphaproteobacteria bacterium]|nr:metallopeptidase TldD-related protein [Alphaproteobacteria bacterium]